MSYNLTIITAGIWVSTMRRDDTKAPTTSVDQSTLIDQFEKYAEIERRRGYLSPNEKGEIERDEKLQLNIRGLCHGCSVVYGYMAATGKLDWWQKVIEEICKWDGKEESLNQVIHIDGSEISQTLDLLLKRAMNYVIYNQGLHVTEGEIYLARELPTINSPFISAPRDNNTTSEIKKTAVIAGYFVTSDLQKLLDKNIFNTEAVFICSSGTHACSIRHKNGTWYFYDPNSKTGEVSFTEQSKIIKYIFSRLGHSLHFIGFTWNELAQVALQQLEKNYYSLFANNLKKESQLIRGNGYSFLCNAMELSKPYSPPIIFFSKNHLTWLGVRHNTWAESTIKDFFNQNPEIVDLKLLSRCSKETIRDTLNEIKGNEEFYADIELDQRVVFQCQPLPRPEESVLSRLLTVYPDCLDIFIEISKKNIMCRHHFYSALIADFGSDNSALEKIIRDYPDKLEDLALFIDKDLKSGFTGLIILYRNGRQAETELSLSHFFKKQHAHKAKKLGIVDKLLDMLAKPEMSHEPFTQEEKMTLKNGRLGKIINHPAFKEVVEPLLSDNAAHPSPK